MHIICSKIEPESIFGKNKLNQTDVVTKSLTTLGGESEILGGGERGVPPNSPTINNDQNICMGFVNFRASN